MNRFIKSRKITYVNNMLEQDYQMSPPPKLVTAREVWRVVLESKYKRAPGFDLAIKKGIKYL